VFVVLGRTRDASSLLGMAFTAVVVGGASIGHYAYYYDARIKQRMLRELATEYGTETMRCQVELRRDGTWVRQINDENTYVWKDFLQLTDSDLGVELWFRNGYLLIRPRAFPTPADRADFVSTARSLAREALAPVVS